MLLRSAGTAAGTPGSCPSLTPHCGQGTPQSHEHSSVQSKSGAGQAPRAVGSGISRRRVGVQKGQRVEVETQYIKLQGCGTQGQPPAFMDLRNVPTWKKTWSNHRPTMSRLIPSLARVCFSVPGWLSGCCILRRQKGQELRGPIHKDTNAIQQGPPS